MESAQAIDMKLEILSEKQNIFLKRKEMQVAVDHSNEATPSKAALQELVAKQFSEPAERVDVRTVYSDRGRPLSLSKIFVWEEPPKKAAKEKKGEAKEEQKTETKTKAQAEEAKAEKKAEA